jgi:hypothetical protein
MPCGIIGTNQRFEAKYCLHHQDLDISFRFPQAVQSRAGTISREICHGKTLMYPTRLTGYHVSHSYSTSDNKFIWQNLKQGTNQRIREKGITCASEFAFRHWRSDTPTKPLEYKVLLERKASTNRLLEHVGYSCCLLTRSKRLVDGEELSSKKEMWHKVACWNICIQTGFSEQKQTWLYFEIHCDIFNLMMGHGERISKFN